MAVSKAMLKRGAAVGLEPEDGESGNAFGVRVRKEEADQESAAVFGGAAINAARINGRWRRF